MMALQTLASQSRRFALLSSGALASSPLLKDKGGHLLEKGVGGPTNFEIYLSVKVEEGGGAGGERGSHCL